MADKVKDLYESALQEIEEEKEYKTKELIKERLREIDQLEKALKKSKTYLQNLLEKSIEDVI